LTFALGSLSSFASLAFDQTRAKVAKAKVDQSRAKGSKARVVKSKGATPAKLACLKLKPVPRAYREEAKIGYRPDLKEGGKS
jgi:hypothetical protein